MTKRAAQTSNDDTLGELTSLAEDYVAVLVIAIANRLTRGASKYYREAWNLGVVEWRIIICLGKREACPIGEIAEAADLDPGATSRSIKLLSERGLVKTETGAGRKNRAGLTKKGEVLLKQLREVGRRREDRLMVSFDPAERKKLLSFLRRLLSQVDFMNADDGTEISTKPKPSAVKGRK